MPSKTLRMNDEQEFWNVAAFEFYDLGITKYWIILRVY